MSVQTPDLHDVAAYAAAVRRALTGLGPDQVDDLTDGLEADLAESLADEAVAGRGVDPLTRFGTPEEYAAELGAAAGLGPVPDRGRPGVPDGVRHPLRALARGGTAVLTALRRRSWWPPVEGFLVALRPVWWLLRAWVLWELARLVLQPTQHGWLPRSLPGLLPLAALVVVSVQWGRGRWRLPGPWRAVGGRLSVVAAVAAVPMLVSLFVDHTQYVYVSAPSAPVDYATPVPSDGVWVGGMQVSNLFVYDAEGKPLEGVQIYDDRGRPVVATDDEGQGRWSLPGVTKPWSFVGVPDSDGRVHWNVYPRHGAPSDQFQWDDRTGTQSLPAGTVPQDPPRPFAQAPLLVLRSMSPSPSVSPSGDGAQAPEERTTPSPRATGAAQGATGASVTPAP